MQDFYCNRVFLHSGTSTFTEVQDLSTSTFTQVQDLCTSTFTQEQDLSTFYCNRVFLQKIRIRNGFLAR